MCVFYIYIYASLRAFTSRDVDVSFKRTNFFSFTSKFFTQIYLYVEKLFYIGFFLEILFLFK